MTFSGAGDRRKRTIFKTTSEFQEEERTFRNGQNRLRIEYGTMCLLSPPQPKTFPYCTFPATSSVMCSPSGNACCHVKHCPFVLCSAVEKDEAVLCLSRTKMSVFRRVKSPIISENPLISLTLLWWSSDRRLGQTSEWNVIAVLSVSDGALCRRTFHLSNTEFAST